MAPTSGTIILKDCFIEIDGVDLSSFVTQVGVTMAKDDVDMTTFGSGTQHQAGLSKDSFEVTLLQSFADSAVDATLWPLYDDETEFQVRVAQNRDLDPVYVGSCVLLAYPPFSGAVGARAEVSLMLPVNGSIAREVSS